HLSTIDQSSNSPPSTVAHISASPTYCDDSPRPLPSFPTRRSSDLERNSAYPASALDIRRRRQGAPLRSADQRFRRRCGACNRLRDRKSTRLNSSHVKNSYAVFCLKKKTSS